MSHLRLVGNEPPKRSKRKGERFSVGLLSDDEQKRAVQALRNLRDAFGTWACMADAMGVREGAIHHAINRKRISIAMLYAASRASGLTIDDLLSVPVPAGMCKACGQVKRYARAS